MSHRRIQSYYDFIAQVVHEAGKIVIEGFYGTKKIETKGGRSFDLVTDCDKKVENLFISQIKKRHPDHLIIGEESHGITTLLTDSPTWIIDPIDGTTNFVYGIPFIGISIALAINKEVVVGIVYNPLMHQFFSAIKGQGAYCNGKKIYSSKNEDLQKAIIGNELSLASLPNYRESTLTVLQNITEHGVHGLRSFGSAAITLCYLANGSLDVYFANGLKCWDVAAGVLILEEAGGYATSSNGAAFDMFSKVLLTAGNKVILQKIMELSKECNDKTSKYTKSNASNLK